MGERGPVPKPAALHQRDGTYRADRHGTCSLPVEIPQAPADLNPRAKAFWDVITRELYSAGLVTRLDRQALRMASDSWSIYLEAMDEIERSGVNIISETKYGSVAKLNPAIAARDSAYRQVAEMLRQFGMTPAARNSLNVKSADGSVSDDEAQVESILGIR